MSLHEKMMLLFALAAFPASATAGDSSFVTDRETALGLSRVAHNDGVSFHYALPSGASTSTHSGNQLTWTYGGQADFAYEQTEFAETQSTDQSAPPGDDPYSGRMYLPGLRKVDSLGRIWYVTGVDAGELDLSVAAYDSWADSEYGSESLSGANPSPGESDAAGTFVGTPLAWTLKDCGTDGKTDMAVSDSESRTIIAPVDSDSARSNAVVSIYVNGSYKCSGSLIDGDFVLTAAHCVIDGSGRRIPSARLDVCTRGNRSTGAECTTAEFTAAGAGAEAALSDGSLSTAEVKLDVGVIGLHSDIGTHTVGLSTARAGDLSGEDVFTVGYPTFRLSGSVCERLVAVVGDTRVEADFQTARMTTHSLAPVTGTGDRTVRTKLDTTKGQSGSPIYFGSRVAGLLVTIRSSLLSTWTGGPRIAEWRDAIIGVMED